MFSRPWVEPPTGSVLGVDGGDFSVVFAFLLVVTVQPLPPIHGTQRLTWSRLAVDLCVARAL